MTAFDVGNFAIRKQGEQDGKVGIYSTATFAWALVAFSIFLNVTAARVPVTDLMVTTDNILGYFQA